jgi:hypothetical protein
MFLEFSYFSEAKEYRRHLSHLACYGVLQYQTLFLQRFTKQEGGNRQSQLPKLVTEAEPVHICL